MCPIFVKIWTGLGKALHSHSQFLNRGPSAEYIALLLRSVAVQKVWEERARAPTLAGNRRVLWTSRFGSSLAAGPPETMGGVQKLLLYYSVTYQDNLWDGGVMKYKQSDLCTFLFCKMYICSEPINLYNHTSIHFNLKIEMIIYRWLW